MKLQKKYAAKNLISSIFMKSFQILMLESQIQSNEQFLS